MSGSSGRALVSPVTVSSGTALVSPPTSTGTGSGTALVRLSTGTGSGTGSASRMGTAYVCLFVMLLIYSF